MSFSPTPQSVICSSNVPPPSAFYTLSLHDALPIFTCISDFPASFSISCILSAPASIEFSINSRSEEHTSELQSRQYLVCRLLLEKKQPHRHDLSRMSCQRNHSLSKEDPLPRPPHRR